MAEKRKDSKGRNLYTGETQDKEGRYRYRYQDARGERQTIYSWRLVETDPQPNGKKTCRVLRTLEKEIERDLDESVDSWSANKITLNQAFDEWIKRNNRLRPSTKSNKAIYYNTHVRNEIGNLTFNKLEFDIMENFFKICILKKP
ncbi:MAG: integrase DNA-binding domain-containing protein [Oscillospiraceae bacterium]|nr:integrase DNA-binding domain-containing protein [Oscillospiraceae bacterium]